MSRGRDRCADAIFLCNRGTRGLLGWWRMAFASLLGANRTRGCCSPITSGEIGDAGILLLLERSGRLSLRRIASFDRLRQRSLNRDTLKRPRGGSPNLCTLRSLSGYRLFSKCLFLTHPSWCLKVSQIVAKSWFFWNYDRSIIASKFLVPIVSDRRFMITHRMVRKVVVRRRWKWPLFSILARVGW